MNQAPTAPFHRNSTLVLLCLVAVLPSLGTLAALWLWPGPVGGTLYAICKAGLYLIPAIVAWRTLDRKVIREGIVRGLKSSPLIFGIASGVLIGGVILLAWNWVYRDQLDLSQLETVVDENGLREPVRYVAMAIWFSVGNALLEEFVFRWFVDSRLSLLNVPGVIAIPLSGLIFTAHHILVLAAYFPVGPTVIFSLGVFIGGVIWSWALRRWRSLLPGWISHALVDAAVFLVGWEMLFG